MGLMSATAINVLVVIDTEYITTHYPNPSRDPNKPTGIDHKSQFMVCADPLGIVSGQGTADLNFKARAGDYISFRGTSIYANSDDAVLVYKIVHWAGDNIFNAFASNMVARSNAIMPNIDTPSGIPAKISPINFSALDSRVMRVGKADLMIQFALYKLDNDGQSQRLFGYYYWDPTITVTIS